MQLTGRERVTGHSVYGLYTDKWKSNEVDKKTGRFARTNSSGPVALELLSLGGFTRLHAVTTPWKLSGALLCSRYISLNLIL